MSSNARNTNPAIRWGEFMAGAKGLDSPPTSLAGIPLSTRDDLGALRFPNLLRIEPFTVLALLSVIKIKPTKGSVEFLWRSV